MGRLPPEVVNTIEARSGGWTQKAAESRDAMGISWEDVETIARTAASWKREKDETGKALDGWKDAITGRDTRGRRMYMAGKRMYAEDEDEVYWYVITIHEAD